MIDDIAGIRQLLSETRRIAIVGLSANWHRPSNFAAAYMLERGYTIIPVNPAYSEIFGLECYPDLYAIPEPVDMVDVFRKPEDAVAVASDAIAIGAKSLWLQLGVNNAEAACMAEAAGMKVVMDRCVKIEYARIFGGLNWAGVNTGIISARRSPPPRLHVGASLRP